MRFRLLLILSVWINHQAIAQKKADTLDNTAFGLQKYRFYAHDISTQSLGVVQAGGRLEIQFSNTNGDFRQAQDAAKEKNVNFETAGTRVLGKFLLTGLFKYNHSVQDSVAYSLRYGVNDPQPYYFFAYKPGNWQAGEYHLNGLISRRFFNDKLGVGIGVDYQAHNAWRSNDPRPEQFHFQTKMEAAVTYRISNKHSIGVSGNIGGRKRESSVQYRNKDYQLSLAYPEYVRRMQYGYGFDDRASTSQLKAKGDTYSWKATYHFQSSTMMVTARGGYSYRESQYTGDSTLFFPKGKYGSFYEDHWSGELYVGHRIGNKNLIVHASYINHLGRDVNEFLRANNYVYSYETIAIQPAIAFLKESATNWELALNFSLTDLFRADGNAGVATDYQFAYAGIQASKYFRFEHKSWLRAELKGGMQSPVSTSITLPVQQSSFVRYAVAGDFYYFDARRQMAGLGVQYGKTFKDFDGYMRLAAQYDRGHVGNNHLQAIWTPGKERWFWVAGIGINLHR